MTADPQTLRAEAFTEIGQAIERSAGLLVERWCRRAIEEQPHAGRAHHKTLRDGLGPLLQKLGRGLAESNPDEQGNHHPQAYSHGQQRWEAGWQLDEVVRDYQILRLVVLEFLEDSLERPLGYREAMAVGLSLDEAISASVQTYVHFRDEDARRAADEQTRRLTDASRRKDEFLAVLAHELRNPLGPILTSLEVMRHAHSDGSMLAEAVAVTERQVNQISRLVDDMLDMTRISHGKVEIRREVVELSRVVAEALEHARPLIDRRRHRLSVELPSAPVRLHADPARLRQVLCNLLTNAAKYTDPGGQIWLSAREEEGQAVLTVRDNGMGLEPDFLPHIFDLFAQSEVAARRAPGGLGIGLALVRGLVEMHGGEVSAHSSGSGQGSEFCVRLPTMNSQADAPASLPVLPLRDARQENVRLLLVDDNSDAVSVLAILLRRLGYDVETAHDGPSALELAQRHRPEVAILDIGLPGMSGYRLAEELLKMPGLGEIGLVAMTGYGRQEDQDRAREAGFHHHLLKPVRIEDLQRVLMEFKADG